MVVATGVCSLDCVSVGGGVSVGACRGRAGGSVPSIAGYYCLDQADGLVVIVVVLLLFLGAGRLGYSPLLLLLGFLYGLWSTESGVH